MKIERPNRPPLSEDDLQHLEKLEEILKSAVADIREKARSGELLVEYFG